jgi:hypothetical protein
MRLIVIAAMLCRVGHAERLRITVYDKAELSPPLSMAVVDESERIFRVAGISIEWVAGDQAASEATLMVYQTPPRNRDWESSCLARRDIALEILRTAPPGVKSTVLGMAQPLARVGLNVRVFYDHVQYAAKMNNRGDALVLAHVIAHETGHVLLRSNAHSGCGLMSRVWAGNEYASIANSTLFFTAGEAREMRMTLSGASMPGN